MRRRDLVLSGLALAAFGAAEALRPRQRLTLLKGAEVKEAIPAQFADWEAENADLITPEQAGRLASSLYSELVSRNYYDTTTGAMVMLLAAYGDTQSDLLQLHRPESCYPAVGFALEMAQSVAFPLGGSAILPARRVIATLESRRENIVYWTRMGEELPRTGGEQREARLTNAVKGFVPDGILVRCSVLGETQESWKVLERFIPTMLHAVQPRFRPALIGTDLSRRIA